jgi:hypothetical protein
VVGGLWVRKVKGAETVFIYCCILSLFPFLTRASQTMEGVRRVERVAEHVMIYNKRVVYSSKTI